MLTRFILIVCLIGAISSVAIMLPVEYLQLKASIDLLIFPMVLGPYAIMAFLAWKLRHDRRASNGLLVMVMLMVALGLYGLGADAAGYRAAVAARGPKVKDLYQRSAVFVVPAVQWPSTLIFGFAIAVQSHLRHRRTGLSGSTPPPAGSAATPL